jgi:hypothetical protein
MKNTLLLFLTALLWQSPNATAQWTRVEAVPGADVYSLSVNGNTIYAGTDSVVYISANNGATWTASNFVTNRAGGVEAVILVNGNLYAGTFARGVCMSANNGQSWQPLNNGLAGIGAHSISAFVEKNGDLYAATLGAGVFVLDSNNPTQWRAFSNNLPLDYAGSVFALALKSNTLIAGAGANGFVYRFPEGATGWTEIPLIPPIAPGLVVQDFAISGNDLFAATTAKVYRSSDNGQTWTFAGNGLVHGLETYLTMAGQTLFAGVTDLYNSFRLFTSKNNGQSWQRVGEFWGTYVYDLAVSGGNLYAARQDGLWFTPLSTVSVDDRNNGSVPSSFSLGQNYPNPFNPQTTLSFSLPKAGRVTLKVYDALGREVATLLKNAAKTAGMHLAGFEAGDLPSGVYFYRLETQGFTATKKMALAR